MKTYYHIMSKTPALSGNARKWGAGYRKFALVESTTPEEPKMISERARGMVKIIACASLFYGKGVRSEGAKFLSEITSLKEDLERRGGGDGE